MGCPLVLRYQILMTGGHGADRGTAHLDNEPEIPWDEDVSAEV